jgi:hypothetical protein
LIVLMIELIPGIEPGVGAEVSRPPIINQIRATKHLGPKEENQPVPRMPERVTSVFWRSDL